MREFTVLVEQDEEGYYIAEVVELKGCYTQARSLDELMERVREAILLHIEGNETPVSSLRWIGVQRIAV